MKILFSQCGGNLQTFNDIDYMDRKRTIRTCVLLMNSWSKKISAINRTYVTNGHVLVSQLETTLVWAVLRSIACCLYAAGAVALPWIHTVKVNIGVFMRVSTANTGCVIRSWAAAGFLLLQRECNDVPVLRITQLSNCFQCNAYRTFI